MPIKTPIPVCVSSNIPLTYILPEVPSYVPPQQYHSFAPIVVVALAVFAVTSPNTTHSGLPSSPRLNWNTLVSLQPQSVSTSDAAASCFAHIITEISGPQLKSPTLCASLFPSKCRAGPYLPEVQETSPTKSFRHSLQPDIS